MTIELLNIDCMEYMAGQPDNAFDAIITDPPYFKVKGEGWDNQWDNPAIFLEWIGRLVAEFERLLKPNGSLYLFASPQMASRVEGVIGQRFNVLNHLVWRKGLDGLKTIGRGNAASKESLRGFFPDSERIIFAEHYNSDSIAKGEAGYLAKCDQLRGFVFEPLRDYLASEWERAGLSTSDCNKATSSQMAGHYLTRTQWALPTEANYNKMRDYANNATGGEYLRKEYDELRKEYDELRKEYDELRKEYDELRRPFSLGAGDQFGDVWCFDPVQAYPGKHPCEKPQALLAHILKASVLPGALVFDPFSGSGSMAIAAHRAGVDFVGCELDPDYYAAAARRVDMETRQVDMFA